MLGRWGIACLAAILGVAVLALAPAAGWAAGLQDYWGGSQNPGNWSATLAQAQTPLGAQMLGEKPFQTRSPSFWSEPGTVQAVPGGASLKLTNDTELRVSFLYDADRGGQEAGRPVQSFLLFKYSLDYRLLSNLQVGISGYLYNPRAYETSPFRHQMGNTMGMGPLAKYDLGHWSFLVQSQAVSDRDRGEKMENWFRVWYSF